jgi:hypothetical protein
MADMTSGLARLHGARAHVDFDDAKPDAAGGSGSPGTGPAMAIIVGVRSAGRRRITAPLLWDHTAESRHNAPECICRTLSANSQTRV